MYIRENHECLDSFHQHTLVIDNTISLLLLIYGTENNNVYLVGIYLNLLRELL